MSDLELVIQSCHNNWSVRVIEIYPLATRKLILTVYLLPGARLGDWIVVIYRNIHALALVFPFSIDYHPNRIPHAVALALQQVVWIHACQCHSRIGVVNIWDASIIWVINNPNFAVAYCNSSQRSIHVDRWSCYRWKSLHGCRQSTCHNRNGSCKASLNNLWLAVPWLLPMRYPSRNSSGSLGCVLMRTVTLHLSSQCDHAQRFQFLELDKSHFKNRKTKHLTKGRLLQNFCTARGWASNTAVVGLLTH